MNDTLATPFGATGIVEVEPGAAIMNPHTGIEMTVTDKCSVFLDNKIYMTKKVRDALLADPSVKHEIKGA